jgi:cysteinyl-tRNA synthetase
LEKKGVVSAAIFTQNLKNFPLTDYPDLATPAAIALLWKLVADSIPDAEKYATILEMDKVLGFGLEKAAQKEVVLTKEVEELLDARSLARQNRDYKEADRLRDELKKHGFAVKDTQDGQEIAR